MNPKQTEKKWSSLERNRFYLVCFGLFLWSMLKGTVRTFSFKIKVRMKTRRTEFGTDLCFLAVWCGGGRHQDQKILKKNLVLNILIWQMMMSFPVGRKSHFWFGANTWGGKRVGIRVSEIQSEAGGPFVSFPSLQAKKSPHRVSLCSPVC